MPHSLKLGKYPAFYLELVEKDWPYRIPCMSEKQAHGVRFKLYGFIEALRKANHAMVAKMDATIIRVELNPALGGWEVVLEDRDTADDPILRALVKETLEARDNIPPVSAAGSKALELNVPRSTHSENIIEQMYGSSAAHKKKDEEK